MKIRTMDDARRANTTGWFAPDAMRWFDTRIESMLYVGPGGAFFVTSEQPPGDVRVFTVRQVHDNGDVETVGEFGRYETADGARGIAAGLAEGTIA